MESVTGLSPAIAIEQRTTVSHPRSTVGTVTEIYDHLRVLFAALGRPHCPRCERADRRPDRGADRGAALASPAAGHGRRGAGPGRARPQGRLPARSWPRWPREGYVRVRVDGRVRQPATSRSPSTRAATTASRCSSTASPCGRARRSGCVAGLEKALHLGRRRRPRLGRGRRRAALQPAAGLRASATSRCRELSPARLLLQQPLRRLPRLRGAGRRAGTWTPAGSSPTRTSRCSTAPSTPGSATARASCARRWTSVAQRHGFSLEAPVRELPRKARQALLQGDGDGFPGVLPDLRAARWRRSCASTRRGEEAADAATAARPSRTCGPTWRSRSARNARGARLRPESLAVRLGGRTHRRLRPAAGDGGACRASPRSSFAERERPVADRLLHGDPRSRLRFLDAVGVGLPEPRPADHDPLRRRGPSHPPGRPDRRAACRASSTSWTSPRSGLHQRDNQRLLDTLQAHPRPRQHRGGGRARRGDDPRRGLGGRPRRRRGRARAAASCTRARPASIDGSLTGRYLRGELRDPGARRAPRAARARSASWARASTTCATSTSTIPLGVLTAVTGVSGVGQVDAGGRHPAIARWPAGCYGAAAEPGRHRGPGRRGGRSTR